MSCAVKTVFLCLLLRLVLSEDYYDLLKIKKDADNRDIRRAFKKLALKMHPDKNTNDEDAHEKFIKISKAYEVLKDEETRKKYDLYGEEGLKDDFGSTWKGSYQSWNFYYESFGIYDDDLEIITFSKSEFEHTVLDSPYTWFINFYSPQCSHCHHLAPSWRKMASELEGIIRIGAVNCEEDWMLCRQQHVHSYPTLIMYPQKERYQGSRETDALIEYVLRTLPNKVIVLTPENLKESIAGLEYRSYPWLVAICKNRECISDDVLQKLSIVLDGLVNVGKADVWKDKEMCSTLNCDSMLTFHYNMSKPSTEKRPYVIEETETRSILDAVLPLLPAAKELSDVRFKEIQKELSSVTAHPWLIEFTLESDDSATIRDAELKRLHALLPGVNLGFIDCRRYDVMCAEWFVRKFPIFMLFKPGRNFEFHHGRFTAHDIAIFVRQCLSSSVKTLSPKDFPAIITSNEPWFIDFYAPWCPPCMQLLPEWRKASRSVGHLVNFGTVDCTIHTELCNKYNIRAYPTAILYNISVPHQFHGSHSQHHLEEFVKDTLNPPVIWLTDETFMQYVNGKALEDMWVIDFFAPWCRPCQQLAPQWRKLAKMMNDEPTIHIGQVDCTLYSALCTQLGVNSYPTIRLYPTGKGGLSKFFFYNGWNRDASSIQAWIFGFFPSKVEALGTSDFRNILRDKQPWVIDFYAPWCGHCQIFAPEFEKIAKAVDGKVKVGKVNCEELPHICNEAAVRAYPTVMFYSGAQDGLTQNPVGEEILNMNYYGIISYIEDRLGIRIKDMRHDEL